MVTPWTYALISVFLVSFTSIIGVVSLPFKKERLKDILIYFVSFSAGALFGDAFIHLLPEVTEKAGGLSLPVGLSVLCGIAISFLIEKVVCWRHCHLPITETHVHRFVYMNLFGDSVHNFIDGLIIGATYLTSIPIGIATTVAIVLHEIPQEIGDFAVLLHGGFTRRKAIFFNFLTALTAVLGTGTALFLGSIIKNLDLFLLPFAAGSFIYIAGSDLIPELHKETETKKNMIQFVSFIAGILIMFSLLSLE
ncbi:ZIP family metal transporter [Candidatus Roizmanbacteria bacterium CG09_land_8_20_14_0_10_41_9]|uniref:ZIP family metal transporter n=1 Tax=Candidatus Roizmanbacteria bacterium CG09_land_8_20_14_0_10_41_9 TaxID=1974850 RepID=A0A2H0WT48_9BACT|nr:MAG: ZIP family metal transporter [Candidatus Roizmanbacteria bacterium CG09_land_8_20_14_0_10_41_9]